MSRKLSLASVRNRKQGPQPEMNFPEKRIAFKDRNDYINGRYFIFTVLYGLYYIISAIVLFEIERRYRITRPQPTSLLLSLPIIGGVLGLLLVWLGCQHWNDYRKEIDIESLLLLAPCGEIEIHRMLEISCFSHLSLSFSFFVALSLFVAIFMSTVWALGIVDGFYTPFSRISSCVLAAVVRKQAHILFIVGFP